MVAVAQAATAGLFATIDGSVALVVSSLHLREVDIDGIGSIGALAGQLTGLRHGRGCFHERYCRRGGGQAVTVVSVVWREQNLRRYQCSNSYATGNVNGGEGTG